MGTDEDRGEELGRYGRSENERLIEIEIMDIHPDRLKRP
jgi:hypothetical protein